MSMTKIAISINKDQLHQVDLYVKEKKFKNRSQVFQFSIDKVLKLLAHDRLAKECAKLDVKSEQEIADEGLSEDLNIWPKY